MNNQDNLEYLFEYQDYHFYGLEEYGFSLKKLAKEHELYEKFSGNASSTYQAIFFNNLYSQHKISQIWAFYNDEPVSLGMAIHNLDDGDKVITHVPSNLKTSLTGHIHFYTRPEHRKKGITTQMVPHLETFLMKPTHYPPSVIMQDDAFHFAHHLKHCWALPFGSYSPQYHENRQHLVSAFRQLMNDNNNELIKLKKHYPQFWKELHQEYFNPLHDIPDLHKTLQF
jgi:GNAT superfamily N-acetyltransferase